MTVARFVKISRSVKRGSAVRLFVAARGVHEFWPFDRVGQSLNASSLWLDSLKIDDGPFMRTSAHSYVTILESAFHVCNPAAS